MKIPVIEQRPHQERNATCFEHIFGNKTAARLQIRDIGRALEDFGHIEEVEFQAALVGDGGQVQRGIGRAAGRRYDCRGVLQRLAGDDIARADAGFDEIEDLLAGSHAKGVTNFVGRRSARRIG